MDNGKKKKKKKKKPGASTIKHSKAVINSAKQ